MQTSAKFKIAFLGAGHTAAVLSAAFLKAGHQITSVWSKTRMHAESLAARCGAMAIDSVKELRAENDVIIIAVPDSFISDVLSDISAGNQILVHTAGSVSREICAPYSGHYGVLYPLQSLRKELPVRTSIPFLIDANTEYALQKLSILAESISTRVLQANDQQRLQMHLSAVFVSNFSNHLYQLASEWCQKHQLPFDMLIPLIQEVALRQDGGEPARWQTGPAARGDRKTIDLHLNLLKEEPFLEKLYALLSMDLLARNSKKDELRTHNSET